VDAANDIVWLCAVHRREEDSGGDAYAWFAKLHATRELLPTADDILRFRAEAVIRLHRLLVSDLLMLVTRALARPGEELSSDLGEYLPCRMLVLSSRGFDEIWCALSALATDGTHVREQLRDLLFAALEAHFPGAIFETRSDWPSGQVGWWEAVRLGLR